jgi:predicted ATPase
MGEFKSRVHWNLTELVKRYTERAPLLVVLEDLHLADASSLELLHFIARQTNDVRLVIIGTFKPGEMESSAVLRAMVPSLRNQRVATVHELGPLTPAATDELVRVVFETDATVAREFASHLHRRTGGNPFFIRETLKALVSAGQLYRAGTQWMAGMWIGSCCPLRYATQFSRRSVRSASGHGPLPTWRPCSARRSGSIH